jgi:molybdopterin-guanine dinucleotide biosynthesis protein
MRAERRQLETAMKMVMVGGHTRNIGKTSVVEGIIRAMPEMNWTAVKITQFGHGVCSTSGELCACAVAEHAFAITTERQVTSGTDTARFLAAGARRALWLRTGQGELQTALPALRQAIADDPYVIVESNSLRRFVKPAIFLQVVDPMNTDFKASARQFFDLADAYLLIKSVNQEMASGSAEALEVLLAREIKRNKPCLSITPAGRYMSQAVLNFIRSELNRD